MSDKIARFFIYLLDVYHHRKIYIYYNTTLIRTHDISQQMYNFNEEDYFEILTLHKVFQSKNSDEIRKIAKENMMEIGKLHAIE